MKKAPLEHLAAKVFGPRSQDPSAELDLIEQAHGFRFPDTLKTILLSYVGAIVFDKEVDYRPIKKNRFLRADGTQSLELLYGATGDKHGIRTAIGTYNNRMPVGTIPIGETAGGNQVCMYTATPEYRVYFWDHEQECEITGERDTDFQNMYLIAKSTNEFLTSLKVRKEDPPVNGKGIGVVSSKLDF
jgi:hypothetical protein